jgi:hypothetical protein
VKELEEQLATQTELNEVQAASLMRLEEHVEFTNRLLAGRPETKEGRPRGS